MSNNFFSFTPNRNGGTMTLSPLPTNQPEHLGAVVSKGDKTWSTKATGASQIVEEILRSAPGTFLTYKEIGERTGLTSPQIQSAILNLRRTGKPVSGGKGSYAWEEEWRPSTQELRRMIALYGVMLANASMQEDGRIVFTGGHIRVVTGRARRSFLTNGKFSPNLVRASYRHLLTAGCVRVPNGPGSFEKELVKSPVDVFGEPPRRSDRKQVVDVTPDPEVRETVAEPFDHDGGSENTFDHGSENTQAAATTTAWANTSVTLVGYTVDGDTIVRASDGQLYTLHQL